MLAGRDAAGLEELAATLSVECRAFTLDDTGAMDRALQDVTVVLHCAGPYVNTAQPMVESCLRTGTHFLDIMELGLLRYAHKLGMGVADLPQIDGLETRYFFQRYTLLIAGAD